MLEEIGLCATLIGGLAAVGYLLEVTFGFLYKFKVFLIFFRNRDSKYLKSTVKVRSVEGDLSKFSDGVELKYVRLKYKYAPNFIRVYFNQTGLRLVADYGKDQHLYLPFKFDDHFYEGKELRLEKHTNKYVLALTDINDDQLWEVVFAVIGQYENEGMMCFKVQINVFQYHPPANKDDVLRSENWTLIGNMQATGQGVEPVVELEPGYIRVKIHFRNFFHEWHYVDGEFVDKGDY